jgi:protein-S-isoprenylcysteine O-methyltransferase Ste14
MQSISDYDITVTIILCKLVIKLEETMAGIWICIALCTIIWFVNGICIVHAVKNKVTSELYMHTGLALFFSILAVELTLGNSGAWNHADIGWLEVTGWLLYVPSAILVISSMAGLSHKGKPRGADFTETTTIIKSGIYGLIRQPMTLGLAIWSLALLMVFQSVVTLILSLGSLFCFRMAAKKESEYNIRKFGDDYSEYMKKVPMWNLFRKAQK